MTKDLTSPDGTPITVRPIEPGELDRIPLRCWPDRGTLDRLLAKQGTIGMAAWEDDKCVAQLHCYRVALPDGRNEDWPEHSRWWPGPTWWPEVARKANLPLSGSAWCHTCFHVGRTLETYRENIRDLVLGLAARKSWDAARILAHLEKEHVVHISLDVVRKILEEPQPSGRTGTFWAGNDPRYFGRGIGTALCKASVQWAREHDYVAVVAPSAPDGLFQYAAWSGHLPWTTYAKLGFESMNPPEEGDELPEWAQGGSPPEVMAEVRAALAAGRPAHEIREQWMVLALKPEVNPTRR